MVKINLGLRQQLYDNLIKEMEKMDQEKEPTADQCGRAVKYLDWILAGPGRSKKCPFTKKQVDEINKTHAYYHERGFFDYKKNIKIMVNRGDEHPFMEHSVP